MSRIDFLKKFFEEHSINISDETIDELHGAIIGFDVQETHNYFHYGFPSIFTGAPAPYAANPACPGNVSFTGITPAYSTVGTTFTFGDPILSVGYPGKEIKIDGTEKL